MELFLAFVAGAALAAVGIWIASISTSRHKYSCELTVEIVDNGGQLAAVPDEARLYLGGELTWDNKLAAEDVTIEFEESKGRRGPFREGSFPVERGKRQRSGKAEANPGPVPKRWKYTVTTSSGKRLDPGVWIKK